MGSGKGPIEPEETSGLLRGSEDRFLRRGSPDCGRPGAFRRGRPLPDHRILDSTESAAGVLLRAQRGRCHPHLFRPKGDSKGTETVPGRRSAMRREYDLTKLKWKRNPYACLLYTSPSPR